MSLKRVVKTLAVGTGGQGVSVVYQLLLPPIFLRHYSVAAYGEWLTLSAAVGYLGTLNFGLQTFANNQTAISYNRGDMEEAHTVQATALAVLLCIVAAAALVTSMVFFLPINRWLGLQSSQLVVSLTIFLLGLQVLAKMVNGFFSGMFLVVGVSYRGGYWNSGLLLAQTIATAIQAMYGVSFPWLAAQQLITITVFTLLLLVTLRIQAAPIFPQMRYVNLKRIGDVVKPSGYFGMLYCANILVFQLPIILMQRLLGPTTVVVFSLTRTIYSMSRQGLTILSQAIGPEINQLYGQRNWARLFRLYELSERVVFALVPLATIGTMLATPALLLVWLHKPQLYDPKICILMALISGVMGIKEHKYQFQTSSNEHDQLARLTFWSYVAMVLVSAAALRSFGVMGFLVPWLATELYQTLAILHLNLKLFSSRASLDFSPVYKLLALMVLALVPGSWFALGGVHRSPLQMILIAAAFCIVLAAISYPLFGLKEVRRDLRSRFGM